MMADGVGDKETVGFGSDLRLMGSNPVQRTKVNSGSQKKAAALRVRLHREFG